MDQQEQQQTSGRSVSVSARGEDVNSLEMAALDLARKFFGDGPRLEVVRDYRAEDSIMQPGTYLATITVREVL